MPDVSDDTAFFSPFQSSRYIIFLSRYRLCGVYRVLTHIAETDSRIIQSVFIDLLKLYIAPVRYVLTSDDPFAEIVRQILHKLLRFSRCVGIYK